MRPRTKPVIAAILALVALLTTAFAVRAQQAATGLAFHQAVTGSTGLVDPSRFERLERPDQGTEMYVSRTATLVIKPEEITSVVITRESVYADTASVTESIRRQQGWPGQQQPIRIVDYYYKTTIHVGPRAAERLHTFTAGNVGQRVDLRFNGTRLGVPMIYEPIASGQIPIGLSGWTHAQIEQVFAVLKPRMTWQTGER
jgi:hypothetical protein